MSVVQRVERYFSKQRAALSCGLHGSLSVRVPERD
jgi:hypothetical protein